MSKIRLHGSSSGYMEIAPPAAGSSETITLPNSAGEVLLSDGSAASLTQIPAANIVGVCTAGLGNASGAFGQGKIIQVAQTVKTDTFSASVGQGSQSGDAIYIDYAAIASTSKLLVSCSLSVGGNFANRLGCFFVVGGVIQTAFRGDTDSGRKTLYLAGNIHETYTMANLAGEALISSPSTNSTRYSYRLIHGDNNTNTIYLNRTHDDDDSSYMHRAVSTITIMEVAA